MARRPVRRGRPEGHGLAARSSRGGGLRAVLLRARRARWCVVAVHSPRVGRRGGAVTVGPVVASRWKGVASELEGTTGRALGKEVSGGAHRGGGATTGRRGG
jgi:hypothetical protein